MIGWEFVDFNSSGNLWVDSNGLDMHMKQLWKRQDFNHSQTKNIAMNFYPVTSAIAIRNAKK